MTPTHIGAPERQIEHGLQSVVPVQLGDSAKATPIQTLQTRISLRAGEASLIEGGDAMNRALVSGLGGTILAVVASSCSSPPIHVAFPVGAQTPDKAAERALRGGPARRLAC